MWESRTKGFKRVSLIQESRKNAQESKRVQKYKKGKGFLIRFKIIFFTTVQTNFANVIIMMIMTAIAMMIRVMMRIVVMTMMMLIKLVINTFR